MLIQVKRGPDNPNTVPSEIFVDGQFECYGLEPARVNPVHAGHPCIAAGTFDAILTPSPHLKYVTPELVGVPGRSDIRIHVGNVAKDSLGCILVGDSCSVDFVGNSRVAFEKLMTLLKTADHIRVEVLDSI